LIKLPFKEALIFFENIKLNDYQLSVVSQVLSEIRWRLQLLVDIGLGYLTLDRLSHSLSGGEAQRINLSTALGSSLVGTLYVLDEPSIGLHSRDTGRLMKILFKLRDLGNTIIVVEHDPDIINNSDFIIDLGPFAGEKGGEVTFTGPLSDLHQAENSLTAKYITGKKKISLPQKRKKTENWLTIYKPNLNNLKIGKAEFPLGCMTVVTGVSGSGKSTLVHDVIFEALKKVLGGIEQTGGSYEKIEGYFNIEQIELVDQSPIGKSSRSTPITYTKVFDLIRELFASTQAARQMGWKPGYFSFNVPGGRCDVCEGEGIVTVEMQFLPDVHLECEACKGSRYKREARYILFKEKTIVDILAMTIDEAYRFFEEVPKITKKLKVLIDVGLGYLKLGQPSSMLSGGESQRVKLAGHLDASDSKAKLFIFDEPTTGLHLDDISKLLLCFSRLTDQGHSVIIIEHNLHIIASADWIIDLGPEAGDEGGYLVATGTPEDIMKVEDSHTGKALREFYEGR
jgi:excinuclease ABC subunit A